jgi:hypothetical protein
MGDPLTLEEAATALHITLDQLLVAIDERRITTIQWEGQVMIEQKQLARYIASEKRDAKGRRQFMED